MPLDLRWETQGPFPVATGILEFLSIFKRSQASSPVEACHSAFLLRYQSGVNFPMEMRRGTRALSKFSTGDSDIVHVGRGNMGLYLHQCREIRPYLK